MEISTDAVWDTVRRLRWGWLAVGYCLETGQWLTPAEAARLTATDTATLRRWAERGLVSIICHGPRTHRRYLLSEIARAARLARTPGGLEAAISRALSDTGYSP